MSTRRKPANAGSGREEIQMKTLLRLFSLALITLTILALSSTAFAAMGGNNGTTLAGYKTIDICSVDESTWRYSGVGMAFPN
jgi:hypothetical protein